MKFCMCFVKLSGGHFFFSFPVKLWNCRDLKPVCQEFCHGDEVHVDFRQWIWMIYANLLTALYKMSDSDSDSDFEERLAAVSCYPPTKITAFNQSVVFWMSMKRMFFPPPQAMCARGNSLMITLNPSGKGHWSLITPLLVIFWATVL